MRKIKEFYVRYQEDIMRIVTVILLFSMLTNGCSHLNQRLGLNSDNFGEELIEWQIQNYTGIDVDLTPDSPEK
jgi:hypothetical protein